MTTPSESAFTAHPSEQCAETEHVASWRAAMGPERNPSPFSNQASAYGHGFREGMKYKFDALAARPCQNCGGHAPGYWAKQKQISSGPSGAGAGNHPETAPCEGSGITRPAQPDETVAAPPSGSVAAPSPVDCDHCGEADGTEDVGPLKYCKPCLKEAQDGFAVAYGLTVSDDAEEIRVKANLIAALKIENNSLQRALVRVTGELQECTERFTRIQYHADFKRRTFLDRGPEQAPQAEATPPEHTLRRQAQCAACKYAGHYDKAAFLYALKPGARLRVNWSTSKRHGQGCEFVRETYRSAFGPNHVHEWCGIVRFADGEEIAMGPCFEADEVIRAAEGVTLEPGERERLGRLVREVWVRWASGVADAKAHWLLPWEQLSERDKEVDRQIGEQLFQAGQSAPSPRLVAQRMIVGLGYDGIEAFESDIRQHASPSVLAELEALLGQPIAKDETPREIALTSAALRAVRRVAPESAAKPPAELYVPKPGERVRVVELMPRESNPAHSVGYIGEAAYETSPGTGGEWVGWLCLHTEDRLIGTWCRVVPAPLTEPEPVPESGGEPCQRCGVMRWTPELPLSNRCRADLASVTGDYECLERALANSNRERDELRSKVSELEAELEHAVDRLKTIVDEACGLQPADTSPDDLLSLIEADNSRWRADAFNRGQDLEKLRSTLTATEAKLAELTADKVNLDKVIAKLKEQHDGCCEANANYVEELHMADAELARVRGELAAHVEMGCKLRSETPAVAAPAVVQREIVVGSTWMNVSGGNVLVTHVDDAAVKYEWTTLFSGPSERTLQEFLDRWRHVSDPAPPTAIPRGTTLDVGMWYRITEIWAADTNPGCKVGDVMKCVEANGAPLHAGTIDNTLALNGCWFAAGEFGGTYVTGLELVPGPVKEQA